MNSSQQKNLWKTQKLVFHLTLAMFCWGAYQGASAQKNPDPVQSGPTGTIPPGKTAGAITDAEKDVIRFLHQATFAPKESEISTTLQMGLPAYLKQQFRLPVTQFVRNVSDDDAPHRKNYSGSFCDVVYPASKTCWRDYYSVVPLSWDFYRQGVDAPDQLRMRVAFALSQILVVSALEVNGTYGLRDYQQMLRNNAFGNYRDLLRNVAVSPVMGNYLSNVNNHKSAPNENFARELLQLFSVGTCQLNMDGSYVGGKCLAVYNTAMVRNYAFALTGWTHPARPGSTTATNKWNPIYLRGQMVPIEAFHDQTPRELLNGYSIAAGKNAVQALDTVIDSVFNHPNLPPFIARQMIQFLVTSNPSPQYIQRVALAFKNGSAYGFGSQKRGDMQALIAAILLDPEARGANKSSVVTYGRLRDPAVQYVGLMRQLNGKTDGGPFMYWYGALASQQVYNAPSVFNFYSPDFPIANATLVGPAFGLETPSSSFGRLVFPNDMVYSSTGVKPDPTQPNAIGTKIDLSFLLSDAASADKLVDRIAKMAVPGGLTEAQRSIVINAVNVWTPKTSKDYLMERVRTATFLIYASPQHLIQR